MTSSILSTSLELGISIARTADFVEVSDCLRQLHPVKTNQPLVRLGATGDGGYLIPDDLDGVSACFSPGVGGQSSFEASMIARGIRCYLADGSVDSAPLSDPLIRFDKQYIGVINSSSTITLDDWIASYCPDTDDLLLQMDIEGSEWPILLNVSSTVLKRFRIIILELHDLDRLYDKTLFPILKATLDRLTQMFHVVHLHPNNFGGSIRAHSITIPKVLEVTLLRKDRAKMEGYATRFPHPLDAPNDPTQKDLVLPKDWYRTNAAKQSLRGTPSLNG